MERSYILHMFTPGKQMSPFDINMAVDAGYQVVVPYCGVTLDEITGLTQDAIFSRGPKGVKATGIFIGGRDVMLAADMLDAARKAMVPPFEVSVIAIRAVPTPPQRRWSPASSSCCAARTAPISPARRC
jgi:methylene-tetrahydromethanopterin dehydrogenase